MYPKGESVKKEIKKVLLLVNHHKIDAEELAREVSSYLEKRGVVVTKLYLSDLKNRFNIDSDTDLAICLGGDGTVLLCARLLYPHAIPMLPVNLGSFGFITEVCKSEWSEAYEYYVEGRAPISERLFVEVEVKRGNKRLYLQQGLNEMTIAASGISKMIRLDLMIDETVVTQMRSDGIIIATPTGSTAYSLAAGGPILDVDLHALIINPICPFTLSNRPLVVDSSSLIRIIIPDEQTTQISLTIDGQLFYMLEPNDEIFIKEAPCKAHFVSSPKRNYYEVLRDKLNWSGGMHA